MSSTIENITCPNCLESAIQEQNTNTLELHTHCTVCGYDSDFEDGFDECYIIDEEDEEFFYGE